MFKTVHYPCAKERQFNKTNILISYPTETDEEKETLIKEIKSIMESVVLQQTKQAAAEGDGA